MAARQAREQAAKVPRTPQELMEAVQTRGVDQVIRLFAAEANRLGKEIELPSAQYQMTRKFGADSGSHLDNKMYGALAQSDYGANLPLIMTQLTQQEGAPAAPKKREVVKPKTREQAMGAFDALLASANRLNPQPEVTVGDVVTQAPAQVTPGSVEIDPESSVTPGRVEIASNE